jgi:hypothetical protein
MDRIMTPKYMIGRNCWYTKALLFVLAIFPVAVNAVWESNSPANVFVTDFALGPSNPAVVLATASGANQGIWYSIVSGNTGTWSRKISSQPYYGAAIQVDATGSMLAGVLGREIEISANEFDLRGPTTGGDSNFSWIIEYAQSEPDTTYAAGYTPGVPDGILQISSDSGNNWVTSSIDGDPNPPTFSLAIAPTDANTVFVGAQPTGASNDGLYKTTDGAASWSYLSALSFTRVDAVAVDPVDLDYVYAGTSNSGLIQRSVDGGANWVVLHDPSNGGVSGFTGVSGLAINPVDRRIVYAVGSGSTELIVSTDCGASWSIVDSTGIDFGTPDKVVIDPINNFVMVRTTAGFMYREALLPNATGDCSANTGTSRSGGSSSGAFDYLLLGMLMLIGVARYRKSLLLRS